MVNSVPFPSTLWTLIVPPRSWIILAKGKVQDLFRGTL